MNNLPEQDGINRRTFLCNAVKSAAVLSALPIIAHATGDCPLPRTQKVTLVYDVQRDGIECRSQIQTFYVVSPVNVNEWQSYLRGEIRPPVIEGRITRVFKKKFVFTGFRRWPMICDVHTIQASTRRTYVIPAGPWKTETILNMFQVQTSDGKLKVEYERMGDDSCYVMGERAKLEVMRFFTSPGFPRTHRLVQFLPAKEARYLPTRIWIGDEAA